MKKIAIIGAGISGLFIANLFKKKSNHQIMVFEKNSSINFEEGYGIQLSVNSVKLLNKIEFHKFEDDKKFNPDKINFYSIKHSKKICSLNISEFNKCLNEHKYYQKVINNQNYAKSIEINATPSFLIFNDQEVIRIVGAQPLEKFEDALNQLN